MLAALKVSVLRRELLMERHKNSHLEGELVKLRRSAVEIVSLSAVWGVEVLLVCPIA